MWQQHAQAGNANDAPEVRANGRPPAGNGIVLRPVAGQASFRYDTVLDFMQQFLVPRRPTHHFYARAWPAEGPPVRLGRYSRADEAFAHEGKLAPDHMLDAAPLVLALVVYYQLPGSPPGKADYWRLARHRRLPLTGPALWKLSLAELSAAVLEHGPLQPEEEALLAEAQAQRAAYLRAHERCETTIDALKALLTEAGISCSAGMPKEGYLDAVLEMASRASPLQLDAGQRAVVDRVVAAVAAKDPANAATYISAGPGAGKTTTVTHLIAAVCQADPRARVLVLVFNVGAEAVLVARLRAMGLRKSIITKQSAMLAEARGCAVLTFDKMAYQINEKSAAPSLADLLYDAPAAPAGKASKAGAAGKSAFGGSYRTFKEKAALALGTADSPPWDLIVVDEGQDVTDLEANLVRGFLGAATAAGRACHLVVAGDPRQEIYEGATWYSNLWATGPAERRCVLHVNYRSPPALVAALNAYSRAVFPSLHHDQVACPEQVARAQAAEAAGTLRPAVRVVEASGQGWTGDCRLAGEEIGAILAARPPAETYAVVPVTLEKFMVGNITAAVRQAVHEKRPGSLTLSLAGDNKMPAADRNGGVAAVYLLATAKRIKGTERPLVVVYGADVDYDRMVSEPAMAKLLFVALSRAQEELVLVTRPLVKQRIKQLIGPFVQAAGGFVDACVPAARTGLELRPIPVVASETGGAEEGLGVAQVPCALPPAACCSVPRIVVPLDAQQVPDAENVRADADFVGCFVEAHVAQALGARLNRDIIVAPPEKDRNRHGMSIDEKGRIILCTSPANHGELTRLVADCQRMQNSAILPYLLAMLDFSARCGRVWTVSERLKTEQVNLSVATEAAALAVPIRAAVAAAGCDPGTVRCWSSDWHLLGDCRRAKALATRPDGVPKVYYVTDAEFRGPGRLVVLELKHTSVLADVQRRQLLAYMVMRQHATGSAVTGLLVNSRTGEMETYAAGSAAANLPDFTCRGRAVIALATARSAVLGALQASAIQPPAALRTATTAIAVDVEATADGRTVEIGAVAVSLTDWQILGTFQARADSVVDLRDQPGPLREPRDAVEALTHLRQPGPAAAEAARLEARFRAWAEDVSAARVFLHWGGSERALLAPLGGAAVDVMHGVFRPWLELRGEGRQGATTLSQAMAQLLPVLPFEPHQAFEDALATLAVLVATTNFAGVL